MQAMKKKSGHKEKERQGKLNKHADNDIEGEEKQGWKKAMKNPPRGI